MSTPENKPIVVVGTHDLEAVVLRRQLDPVVDIVAFVPEPGKALEMVRERHPTAVVLFMDHDREGVLALARQLVTENIPSVMVSRDRSPDTILLAMRSGARDFAYLEGEEDDVLRAINAIVSTAVATPATRGGTVVVVFGCKGGVGATMIATNLAGALLENDEARRVAILDIDPQLGDVPVFLDISASYSWADLLRNLHRLDDELVHRTLVAHPSGLRVIAQTDLEDSELLDAAAVTKTLGFLRQHYEYIIVDGGCDFHEMTLAALDAADRIALVMTQDVPALKNARRCLGVFRKLGYRADKLKLVVNRYHKRDKLDFDTVADALGAQVDATIANDYPRVIRSINEGVLLVSSAPHAVVTDDIRALLQALELAPREVKRGWFRRQR